ncbi:hypothetical protein PENNAL_c0020G05249 [Penicillium nalgiovense]|uniref:Amidohydrolase-related domain-containing protein n=1 Tax=Penicillium nalgiovense TaxID=60175 RepID=A0A1V6YI27_PENNA|nr:hypothetical protein PENNAL_c0020G05249 [Penicillium nalgiovense]
MSPQSIISPRNSLDTQPLLPKNVFDTHTHIFDPDLGPYAAGRAYTPEDAQLKELLAFNQSLSKDPPNNTLVLKLKDQNINAFGIAVLDLDNTTDAQLRELHTLGIRGIRLNFQADGKELNTDKLVATLHRTADRVRHLPGWMIQLFVPGWSWDNLHDTILELPVKIIADHLGGMRGASKLPSDLQSTPTSQPGFKSLLSLAKQSHIAVKVSGLYRMSSLVSGTYSDLQPILEAFAQEIPEQLIWGTQRTTFGLLGKTHVDASSEAGDLGVIINGRMRDTQEHRDIQFPDRFEIDEKTFAALRADEPMGPTIQKLRK